MHNLHVNYFLTRSTRNNDPTTIDFAWKKKRKKERKRANKIRTEALAIFLTPVLAQKRARPPRYTLCRYLETASGLHLAANIVCKPTVRAREGEKARATMRETERERVNRVGERKRERERDREA